MFERLHTAMRDKLSRTFQMEIYIQCMIRQRRSLTDDVFLNRAPVDNSPTSVLRSLCYKPNQTMNRHDASVWLPTYRTHPHHQTLEPKLPLRNKRKRRAVEAPLNGIRYVGCDCKSVAVASTFTLFATSASVRSHFTFHEIIESVRRITRLCIYWPRCVHVCVNVCV